MSNPWSRKNPFMSLFLSGANRLAGTVRGKTTAQAKRQINAAVSKATSDNFKAVLGGPRPKVKRRR